MGRTEFLALMSFPRGWWSSDLYPDELWEGQLAVYEPGNEEASEHFRNGAFHWWLKRSPDKALLLKLVELSFMDPDPIMASDVRRYIRNSRNVDQEVAAGVGCEVNQSATR